MNDIVILQNFEIYIPKEAEVKTTLIHTLPNSVLRRMGVPCSQGNRATRGSSLLATWISPVDLRKRCSPASPTENTVKKNLASLVTIESKEAQGPFLMPFISSSYTAFKVLTEFLPSRQNLRQGTHTQDAPLPQGPPPPQDTIFIHHGRIFLSITKAKTVRGKRQHGPDLKKSLSIEEPPQTTPAEIIYLSPARKRQMKHQVEKELLQSFGLTHQVQVELSRISPGDLERQQAVEQCLSAEEAVITKQNQVVRKLLNANKLSMAIPGRCLEQEKEFMTQEHKSLIDSDTSYQHLCSSVDFLCGGGITSEIDDDQEENHDEEGGHNFKSVKRQQVKAEDRSKNEKEGGARGQATHGEEPDVGDLPSEMADALNDTSIPPEAVNADESMDIQVCATDYVTGDCDKVAECPVIPSPSSTQIQFHGFDFEQSARKERINRIRAKLKEREAALNNLRPPS